MKAKLSNEIWKNCKIYYQKIVKYIFLEILSRVRSGGLAIIPNTTYEHLQSKRRGVEALLKVLNFRIEVPQQEIKDLIIASKTL